MSKGPNFIGIGQMKSGTGWLFDQFYHHPDVWMPRTKELHFFDKGMNRRLLKHSFRMLLDKSIQRGTMSPHVSKHWSEYEDLDHLDRDFQFFSKLILNNEQDERRQRLGEKPNKYFQFDVADLNEYVKLFPRNVKCAGEITPAYCSLPTETIARIVTSLPTTRFILILRHPVDRMRSHLSQRVYRGYVDADTLTDPAMALKILRNRPIMRRKSDAAMIAKTWLDAAQDRLKIVMFDSIRDTPDFARNDICNFLGISTAAKNFPFSAHMNAKASKRLDASQAVIQALEEELSPEVESYLDMRSERNNRR